jgi:hypothetical protein
MLDFEIKKMLEITEESDQTFFKMDCIHDRYSINRKGLIFDDLNKRDVYPSFTNGYLRVYLNIDGQFVKFDLRKLLLMCFSPMYTTLDVYMNVLKVISFDNNLCNFERGNLIWRVPFGGVECLKYSGFYSIPGNPNIVISKEGEVLDYKTGFSKAIVMPQVSDRYPAISNDAVHNGMKTPFQTSTIHRLMCLAFHPLDGIRDRFYVNHIDGNKLNFDIKNLEWVTYKENRDHAVEAGLCVQSVRLMAIDIYTGERRKFPSLQAASRGLNFHAWDISKAIDAYRGQGKIICPPWLFLEEGDRIPTSFIKIQRNVDPVGIRWFLVEKDGVSKYCSGVVNLFRHVSGTKDVIEAVKVPYNTFKANGFDIKEVYRQDVPPEEYKKEEENRGGKVQKAIRVTTLSSGAVATYPSTDHFAALVGAKRKTIQRGMLYNNGVWHDFKIEYVDSL